MEEFNKHTLKKAISNLPLYEAPGFLWDNIEAVLVADEQDAIIKATIPHLPHYQAPDSVWIGIETALDKNSTDEKQHTSIISIRRIAIAASFVGLAIWFSWQSFFATTSEYTLSYSEEEVAQFEYEFDPNEDEASFNTMLDHFKSSVVAKQHEEYNNLLEAYEELKIAKEELVQILENYGSDPDIIQQMSDIEHERSRVIKQMAALI